MTVAEGAYIKRERDLYYVLRVGAETSKIENCWTLRKETVRSDELERDYEIVIPSDSKL